MLLTWNFPPPGTALSSPVPKESVFTGGGCGMGERFFRRSRQIFEGILCVCRKNLTKRGGKRSVQTMADACKCRFQIKKCTAAQTFKRNAVRRGMEIPCVENDFLRWHYPDQVQGTGDGTTPHISAELASSAPAIRFVQRSPLFYTSRSSFVKTLWNQSGRGHSTSTRSPVRGWTKESL